MNKKLFSLLLAAICVMSTGCSLASQEVNNSGAGCKDELVGVVVTFEYLDLFDMEAYLQDNLDDIMAGKNPGQTVCEGRLYAQEEIEESTTEDGVTCTTTYYNFDHVDGIAMLNYWTQTLRSDGTLHSEFTTGTCDEGLWEVFFSNELCEGVIYVPKDAGEVCIYTNPVYQDGEGRLYLVPGTGICSDAHMGEMSQWVTEEYTETENGQEFTRKREFRVTVRGAAVPDSVAVIQMSGENGVIQRREYLPGQLPEELTPEEDCAYILIEQNTGGAVTRTLIEPGEDSFQVFLRADEVCCGEDQMEILWPDA